MSKCVRISDEYTIANHVHEDGHGENTERPLENHQIDAASLVETKHGIVEQARRDGHETRL